MRSRLGPVQWLRERPVVLDAFIASVLLAIGLLALFNTGHASPVPRHADALGVVLVVANTVALAWRHRSPTVVLAVAGGSGLLLEGLHYRNAGGTAVIVALYTLAARCNRRRAVAGLLATAVAVAVVIRIDWSQVHFEGVLANYVVFVTAWVLGYSVQTRRHYVAEVEARADRLERDREEDASRAAAAERARIARELHDVVAHNVSVMVISAGAARRVMDTSPADAKEALASIEETGRSALAEMRRMLGMLRGADEDADLHPQPSVDQLDALVDLVREAGVDVDLKVEGGRRPLASGVDLSVYRIVQEALTNTIKHAGSARATVRLRYGTDTVQVEVDDDGRGASAVPTGETGHGLVGMKERVMLFGGQLDVGPRRGGGYRVRATLPTEGGARRAQAPSGVEV
jgi:signal transduction histidine kinase